jgi:hypothetical protein
LDNPSYRLLSKNFIYLRHFAIDQELGTTISSRLQDAVFTFPFHRAYLYRLAAYSRDDNTDLKEIALREVLDDETPWVCRMSGLFCLGTFSLSSEELAELAKILDVETNPQVIRAAFVVLCQFSGAELRWLLDRVSLFNAPHQDYLRRYFFQLVKSTESRKRNLSQVKSISTNAPVFIHHLHKLDLLKANSDTTQRQLFKEVVETKMKEIEGRDWPRLKSRFNQLYDSFIVKP